MEHKVHQIEDDREMLREIQMKLIEETKKLKNKNKHMYIFRKYLTKVVSGVEADISNIT